MTLPRSYEPRRNNGFTRSSKQAGQIEALVASRLDVVCELYHHDVGHSVPVSLGAAFRVTLCSAYSQDIHRATVASEEAAVVKSVGVYLSVKALWCAQGELHTVFVAHLTNYGIIHLLFFLKRHLGI